METRLSNQQLHPEFRLADDIHDVCSAIAPKLKEGKERDKNKGRDKSLTYILFQGVSSFLIVPKEAIEIGL